HHRARVSEDVQCVLRQAELGKFRRVPGLALSTGDPVRATDEVYCGLPWKAGGRSRAGLDCAGLAWLWLREEAGLPSLPVPQSDAQACGKVPLDPFDAARLVRGDIVFLSASEGRRRHVMVYL